jgi:capsular exopolysaccharide synthesis family protein
MQHHVPQLDLATLFKIIREWRWLIVAAAVLGLVGGILVTMLTTPLYRAWVTLEANPPRVQVLEGGKEMEGQGTDNWDFIATQVGLLQSRSVAERAAQDLNLASKEALVGSAGTIEDRLRAATSIVAGGLAVEMPESGTLIRYSYTSADPQLAASVANGVADSFINAGLQRRFESSAYARQFLERQIAKTRTDLERSETQLASYAQAQGIISIGGTGGGEGGSPEAGSSLQGASLAALNEALAAATARRVSAEGAYRAAAASGPTSDVNESTQALRQTRAALEAEYSEKLTIMKAEHPEMISLRTRIDALGGQIAREGAQVSAGRSNSLGQEFRAAAAAERALQGRVAQLKGQVLDLRGRSVRYAILQREVDTNRGLYDALLQRYKEIGVAQGVGASSVSIVDRAEVPGGPFKPNMPLNLLAGLALGLVGGLGAAVGLELLRDTIRTREDMRKKLGLACIGQIPKRNGEGGFVEDLKDPSSAVSEAYSATTAALRFTTAHGVPRVLMVTSTTPAEGKSSSALALAQNFARRGYNVLLVDADLRKPSFRAANEDIGLTKLLTNDEAVLAHTAPTQFENLSLLPCGPIPPNPADLLATGRFGTIIEEALTHYQLVIVDSSPVLGLADAPLIAHACGNVLYVVEAGVTRTRQAAEALNRLEASGAHLVGGLLTKSVDSGGAYGYYNYRYGKLDGREKIAMIPHHQEG